MITAAKENGKAHPDPGCSVPKGNMSTLLRFNYIAKESITCCVKRSMHIQILLPPVAICLVWAPARIEATGKL